MASVLEYTPVKDIPEIVATVRKGFTNGKTKSLSFRKQQLRQLHKLATQEKDALAQAVYRDLRKPEAESFLAEIGMVANDAAEAVQHLDEWAKPTFPAVDIINAADKCQVRSEPFGVVLIIGAWNYPIQLTLVPLVGAIAAGNVAVIKPSELSQHTAKLLAELLPKYLDPSCFKVVNGAVKETSALLEEKFDHIIYTGSGPVGKIVMTAAAKNLTPVLLELGGKSPVVVDKNVNITNVARRIAWGRFSNCGQTCIAPDYVLCHRDRESELVSELKKAINEYYGEDPSKSSSYGRIVNKNHFNRIKKLVESSKGTVVIGGNFNEDDLYISPTVVTGPSLDDAVMKDEIFGPVLPIVKVTSVVEAIQFINSRDKPLALYVFSESNAVCEMVLQNTSSGSALANDTLMQAAVSSLPFGGVGPSGTGAYHGKHSFDAFSHKKSVMIRSMGMEFVNNLRYAPYTESKLRLLKLAITKPLERPFPVLKVVLALLIVFFLVKRPQNRVSRAVRVLLGVE